MSVINIDIIYQQSKYLTNHVKAANGLSETSVVRTVEKIREKLSLSRRTSESGPHRWRPGNILMATNGHTVASVT